MSLDPADPMDIDDGPLAEHDAHTPAEGPASSDEESGPEEAPVELMVASRARRTNAGNRMSTLIAKSAEEEEWGEEWEDAPNEEEFVGDDANEADDFNLESSSSEEGDDDGDDDDTGEKELRRAERHDRIKKAKPATNPFAARLTAVRRKKVKLDVPLSDAHPSPAPRPKKKSERASWIPAPEDGPVRTSSRKQTILNKEHTLLKLKEKDRRRDDTLAMMKAAEARKAKDEPKTLTQAERIAEASRVERLNSKSLHRWEEAEEQRAAERQAKLDALKNRQIDGPFIRYWSGPAIWVDDKIKYTGKGIPKVEDLDEKLNKDFLLGLDPQAPKSENVQHFSTPRPNIPVPRPDMPNHGSAPPAQIAHVQGPSNHAPTPPAHTLQGQTGAAQQQPQTSPVNNFPQTQPPSHTQHLPAASHSMQYSSSIMFPPPQTNGFLSGIEQYASQQHPTPHHNPQQHPAQSTPQTNPQQPPTPAQIPQHGPWGPPAPQTDPSHFPSNPFAQQHPPYSQTHQSPFSQPHPSLSDPSLTHNNMTPQSLLQQFQRPSAPPPPPAPLRRKIIRKALRNLLILSEFPNLDEPAAIASQRSRTASSKEKDRSALIQLSVSLFGWSPAEAASFVASMLTAPKTKKEREGVHRVRKELCAVTNKVARYRDPGTGIAYHDQKAFAVLRGVVSGNFVWSGALGCYVGGRAQQRGGAEGAERPCAGVKPAAGVPKRFADMAAGAPVPVVQTGGPANPIPVSTPGAATPGNGSGVQPVGPVVKMEDAMDVSRG